MKEERGKKGKEISPLQREADRRVEQGVDYMEEQSRGVPG